MYLDESYKINEIWPKALLESMKLLDEYYAEGDKKWREFEEERDCLESSCKNLLAAGRLSLEDFNNIFRRYGLK